IDEDSPRPRRSLPDPGYSGDRRLATQIRDSLTWPELGAPCWDVASWLPRSPEEPERNWRLIAAAALQDTVTPSSTTLFEVLCSAAAAIKRQFRSGSSGDRGSH